MKRQPGRGEACDPPQPVQRSPQLRHGRDNIEKVRKDEEEARLEQLKQEGRMTLADSEARIDALRSRSGQRVNRRDAPGNLHLDDNSEDALIAPSGHVNLFNALEESETISTSSAAKSLEKKMKEMEAERGFALAPDPKDLRPWYAAPLSSTEESPIRPEDVDSEELAAAYRRQQKKTREETRKNQQDPMRTVDKLIGKRTIASSARTRPGAAPTPGEPPERAARMSREAGERARALALIRQRQLAFAASDGASTIGGDTPVPVRGYGDLYNRRETQEAGVKRQSRREQLS